LPINPSSGRSKLREPELHDGCGYIDAKKASTSMRRPIELSPS
jgi:hypothetical protein